MNYLVAGLGNIGAEYHNTRHNMGFIVLDAWKEASGTVFSSGRYGSIAEVSNRGDKFFLLKPSTYMNLSGNAIRYWMQEKKIPVERLIVICDDLNLPFGTIRMRAGGSAGGHNGLKNIEETIGTNQYTRIRLGIGNEYKKGQQIDFVLGSLSEEELKRMGEISSRVIEGIKLYSKEGIGKAMTTLNAKVTANTTEEPKSKINETA